MQTTYEHGMYRQRPHATRLTWEISLTYSTSYGKSIPHTFGVDLAATYLIPRVPHRGTRSLGINLVPFSRRPRPVPYWHNDDTKNEHPDDMKITRHAQTLLQLKQLMQYTTWSIWLWCHNLTSNLPKTHAQVLEGRTAHWNWFSNVQPKLGRVEPLTKAH